MASRGAGLAIVVLLLFLIWPCAHVSAHDHHHHHDHDHHHHHHDHNHDEGTIEMGKDAQDELLKLVMGGVYDTEQSDKETKETGSATSAYQELEESLRRLSESTGNELDIDDHSRMIQAEGASADDVISLLHRYAYDLHDKVQAQGDASHDEHDDHYGHVHNHHSQEHRDGVDKGRFKLPEEIEEEIDLQKYGFEGQGFTKMDYSGHSKLPTFGLWMRAMGSSLLVSMASLICLMFLPFIVSSGKPSRKIVDGLAAFGAGAMLGDAFLHQLPHAFGGSQDHSHSHNMDHHDHAHTHTHSHDHTESGGHGHAHSLQDLSIGLAVLGGILLFFIVEKIVRRVEELSMHGSMQAVGHSHHHHHKRETSEVHDGGNLIADGVVGEVDKDKLLASNPGLRERSKGATGEEADNVYSEAAADVDQVRQPQEASGARVLGYLNLFSDALHNFTDGMALGTAFLLHGPVGGWSRTLFLLAHELPQEVGDFGILVRSGFGVVKALAFNFLSALVAMAGTAVALVVGGNPGHSSLIEGFTAGGFIYISVAGVLPDMHTQGTSLSTTVSQLSAMILGIGVAVIISLAE